MDNKKEKKVVIAAEHLFFSYHQMPVLQDATFKVYEGEFVGVIGPNGGGKTTLLKLIMGFLSPDSGKIEVFGQPAGSQPLGSIPLAYVPQAMRFDRDFPISVEEVVLSGLLSHLPWYGAFHKRDKEAVALALDEVGLSEYSRSAFGTLSGGQAQRVLIARALVSRPRLLLLDEPTASVDSKAEADIYAILKRLKGQMTILMVTHDLKAAIDQVERILCVQKTLFSLEPNEVCDHFAVGLYHPPLIQTLQNNKNKGR